MAGTAQLTRGDGINRQLNESWVLRKRIVNGAQQRRVE
jgi:hypothetical protein